MPITPQQLANAEQIDAEWLALSSQGDRVVYSVGPAFITKGDNPTRALWLADVGVAGSARKITSGLFNDTSPAFDPNTGDVFFLSDRHKAGGKQQIYRIAATVFGGEPVAVTETKNVRAVESFAISPDGNWLAYLSADEPEDKDEEDSESYVKIWRESKTPRRLRLLGLTQKIDEIQTIVATPENVASFTWSPDSTKILYRLSRSHELEDMLLPVSEHIVSIGEDGFPSTHVTTHEIPQYTYQRSIWPNGDGASFFFLGAERLFDAPSLYMCAATADASQTKLGYGQTDDATALRNVGSEVAVQVATGLYTEIDVFSGTKKLFTAFRTTDEAIEGWDMKKAGNRYVFVALRSSGIAGEPENLWSGSTDGTGPLALETKLSSHHEWAVPSEMPQSTPFSCTAEDGTQIDGVLMHRRGETPDKLPTVVVPHGGPYARDALALRFGVRYATILASNGFLVVCPNYRGSQGRGSAFSRAAHSGMGTSDYTDCENMLDAAIAAGYAHPENVAIAGYSQGGFLSAWGITRPNARWKTACIGAGPTDWGTMALTGDLPDLEVHLAGNAPWSPSEPQYLSGSPIRDVNNVNVPILVLHGENDVRVPVSQAIGFMRGIVREADKSVGEESELVVYPREGHGFRERAHVEDQLTRVLAHLQKYLLGT
uniref:Dipeptidyl-peptidase V n=1 Tax=Mycena chlorophos TaxID=658473 RepID=A0ABQ0LGN6_MYCCL|nr:predicted protein [Mycena chlorophos]